MKAKLIVIDGTDGSGKATQTKLLIDKLRREGFPVNTLDFPQYRSYSSEFVKRYLKGEYGSAEEVNPKKASLFYAMDRFAASFKIKEWLSAGNIVILDRYIGSNLGHQGGKIKDSEERKKFYEWNIDLEYNILGIPKPDISLLLYVPFTISQKLAARKWNEKDNKVKGMGNKQDIHESNTSHLKAAEESYLEVAKIMDGWFKIDCFEDGQLMTKEKIHQRVWEVVRKIL